MNQARIIEDVCNRKASESKEASHAQVPGRALFFPTPRCVQAMSASSLICLHPTHPAFATNVTLSKKVTFQAP